MLMLQVRHWNVRSVQRGPTVLEEVYASITGINYRLGLRVESQMSITKNMDTTVNTSKKKVEQTVQSKVMKLFCALRKFIAILSILIMISRY